MKQVVLHGSLAKFGGPYDLDIKCPAEAVRALAIQIPGFDTTVRDGDWRVVRGSLDDGEDTDVDELHMGLGKKDQVHILPAVHGAGGDGVGKVIGGIALVAASFIPGLNVAVAGAMFSMGVSMGLGGVSMMLTSTPSSNYNERESPDERPSYLFNGPVNTSTQGLPVPIIYGRMRTGSIVVSAGMTSEELDA